MTNNSGVEAIIILGHGSRVPGAAEGMEKTAARLSETGRYAIVELCYMSKLGPHLPEAFGNCVRQGATKVLVMPYFLHTGLHLVLDIPEMLQELAQQYPHVKLVLGKNLGYDDCLVDLVAKRIEESQDLCDVRELELPSEEDYPMPG